MDSCLEYLFFFKFIYFFTPDIKYTFCVVADEAILAFFKIQTLHTDWRGGFDSNKVKS